MASTFSPDLRLELIGTGDQAGAWGATLNANLGTLIESAIAGAATVTVTSAAQALTALNGADDQARHAILVLNNTNGANFSVFAPPVPKVYVVYNASAYTATIYNSTVLGNTTAAGTGVQLATGQKLLVFSDGTNFRTIDALSAGTAGNVSGVVAIANGGTGASTAAAAFSAIKQAASTTSTGVVELATNSEVVDGTDTTRAATSAGVEAHMRANALGWTQTWQDVSSSRAGSTWYQNTTGRPIEVLIAPHAGQGSPQFRVGISTASYVTLPIGYATSYVVPNGHYYYLAPPVSPAFDYWFELR
jgi:hypothetical protein